MFRDDGGFMAPVDPPQTLCITTNQLAGVGGDSLVFVAVHLAGFCDVSFFVTFSTLTCLLLSC
jgi:hypothetical protein